ncbi:PrpF protein [Penicillium hispanicum]|uniref:PrpF protein n=1 Tax=Penicillium hispanicum TaxID=1080232 RepID=UPI002540FA56|nr:PrpF protein [Penicillium hispanicum]KAJ5587159.1 PrpF protein [Penicillium hispanicum]
MAAVGIPAAYTRGGTSKAVLFHARHIPAAGPARDSLLKTVMDMPNQTQPSERTDADVDYTFAQVGITDDMIGYDGNCRNISSAVGSFALDEGLVKPQEAEASQFSSRETTPIRIFNTGTSKVQVLISHTPFNPATGKSIEVGDHAIAGVGGTGAPILMDYQKTIGSARNKSLLPSGNVVDRIQVDGKVLDVTISDAGDATAIFRDRYIGLTGYELATDLTADKLAISKIMEIRAKAAHKVGMCTSWQTAEQETPFFPFCHAVPWCLWSRVEW